MSDISHYTNRELVRVLRKVAPHSTNSDLLTLAADRLDPMQELADGWRAEDTADEQAAEIARLTAALASIANITERKENRFPDDWRTQIAACPECQRYAGHPVQLGICDAHRKPIYAQEAHDAHETKILGYRAISLARAALQVLP